MTLTMLIVPMALVVPTLPLVAVPLMALMALVALVLVVALVALVPLVVLVPVVTLMTGRRRTVPLTVVVLTAPVVSIPGAVGASGLFAARVVVRTGGRPGILRVPPGGVDAGIPTTVIVPLGGEPRARDRAVVALLRRRVVLVAVRRAADWLLPAGSAGWLSPADSAVLRRARLGIHGGLLARRGVTGGHRLR